MNKEQFIDYLIGKGFVKNRRIYQHGNTKVYPFSKGFDVIIYRGKDTQHQDKRFYYYPDTEIIADGFWAMMGKKRFDKL